MATGVLEIVNIPDNTVDDDEISVVYSMPAPIKKGTSKFDAIPVEDYPHKPKTVIDLSQNSSYFDDEVKLLYSFSKPRKRFCKGESSNTKSAAETQSSVPLAFVCESAVIPVENYPHKPKTVIDLSQNSSYFDDEVKLLYSFSKPRKGFYKGESSNTKSPTETQSSVPLTFMCEICADEKPSTDLFRVLGCDHSYCSECMGKYVASKLQENITTINCPVLGCNGFLAPLHCRSILPKQVFDRWGDVLCESVILASEKFYCPYKDCSALLIDDTNGNEVIRESDCPYCNRLFCVVCKVPWHTGIDCSEFQKLKEDERSNEDLMLMNLAKNNKWMRCSKCKFYVEKSAGCLFMRCRCGHSFCYNCGAPMKEHYCRICKQ